MAQKSGGDLLQALLERQRREKQASITPDSAPTTTDLTPKQVEETKPTPTLVTSPNPVPNPPAKIEVIRQGIQFTPKELLVGLVVVLGLIVGAYYLGTLNTRTGRPSNTESEKLAQVPDPPSAGLFSWNKAFTIQAVGLGSSKSDEQKLTEMKNYLESFKIAASPVQFPDAGKIALFVGGADRADDKSLVKLRDWLRELPGPDGAGKPFKSASIRETPRNK